MLFYITLDQKQNITLSNKKMVEKTRHSEALLIDKRQTTGITLKNINHIILLQATATNNTYSKNGPDCFTGTTTSNTLELILNIRIGFHNWPSASQKVSNAKKMNHRSKNRSVVLFQLYFT